MPTADEVSGTCEGLPAAYTNRLSISRLVPLAARQCSNIRAILARNRKNWRAEDRYRKARNRPLARLQSPFPLGGEGMAAQERMSVDHFGLTERGALIREALKSLIAREAGRRLLALAGTAPNIEDVRRLRVDEL